MVATDEDALACDFAETYHIYDFRQLPLTRTAVFACGLGDSSRIMMRLSDQRVTTETLLMAQITDGINNLMWSKTEDAENGKNRPKSIVAALLGTTEAKSEEHFSSGEDFERARRQILMQGGDDNGD
ncbi:DUF5361 domain-containing protein [Lacticaseibacillus salsurivasis]|uniref:DUF5361 domain-containing protein n=1 Tax=Lacticaseibacillus salsurivasis TaxID=3081441 RepID=UPI0030C67853